MRIRITSAGIAAWLSLMIAASTVNGQPQSKPEIILDYTTPPRLSLSLDDQKEIAGLSRQSKPEVLNWQTAYTLALVRSRSGRGTVQRALDRTFLAASAERLGVGDFARFRIEFLARGAFRDPAPAMFAVLARLQRIENARYRQYLLESLEGMVRERLHAPTPGAIRLENDIVLAASLRSRQELHRRVREFRDELDELKVELGLAPTVAMILAEEATASFKRSFSSVACWKRDPNPDPEKLSRMIEDLPKLGNIILDNQPLRGASSMSPERIEEVMSKATRLALEKSSDLAKSAAVEDANGRLELQIRRRLRRLFDTSRAYDDAKQRHQLATRIVDQEDERLLWRSRVLGSDGVPAQPLLVGPFIEQVADLTSVEDQLIELWTTFRTEWLAFYRDIGV